MGVLTLPMNFSTPISAQFLELAKDPKSAIIDDALELMAFKQWQVVYNRTLSRSLHRDISGRYLKISLKSRTGKETTLPKASYYILDLQ